MAILVNENSRVIIQGITGREGVVRAQLMKDYGTKLVAGVTPGRAGQDVYGVPVYDSVLQAWEKQGPIDVSVIFVPDEKGAQFVGPNTLGLVSPGKAVLGMIGGRAERAREWFRPGPIGVSSRSGGMTSAISYYLTKAGLGLSTIVHVGGDAVIGLSHPEIMALFEHDPETRMAVMFGEIGTTQEERVADLVETGRFTKPLFAYIGGKAAKSGTRFSHAVAIVEGTRGSYETKVKRLREVGVHVVDAISDIHAKAKEVLGA